MDEPQRRNSSSPEPLEIFHAISFGDEGSLSDEGDKIHQADNESDSVSVTRTESTAEEEEEEEESFYDTRDIPRIEEEEGEGEASNGKEMVDRDSARTPSPGSYSQTTAEPASPAQSTTPIVTRTVTRASSPPLNKEVIVPVVVDNEEEQEAAAHDSASAAREEVDPPTDHARSSSTASFSDDNKATTYPPSLHRKTSGDNGTPLPVVLATDAAATTSDPIHVPPDGGWRAWANVVGGFLVLFASLGLVSAFGVFQVYYVQVKAVLSFDRFLRSTQE